ncbi:MAG TPA: GIY-YIG nuclease family protein [bacterium]|nr:GIY-YIG nuclease family protein [bacterium]HPR87999.1 GIY-YIG nuclease family protein [bacterium]
MSAGSADKAPESAAERIETSGTGERPGAALALFQAELSRAPQTPGVYIMRDGDGHVIYVGKSVNLRSRLRQHAASLQAGYSDRNYRWIWHIRALSWHETASELYALLLEDQWIKQHWPVGNVRQKDYLEYAWLAFSVEPLPRLLVIGAHQRQDLAPVFGPFHDAFHARDMADLVQARFRLRTCPAVREGGCLQAEIRKCSGPCRSAAAAARYRETIRRAMASLCTFDQGFLRFIDHNIRSSTRKREFEKAAWLHALGHRYRALIQRQEFLARFRHHGLVVREKGRWPAVFYFLQGKLVWREGGVGATGPIPEETGLSEWQIIDRAQVIWQWLHRQRSVGEAAILDARFFDAAGLPGAWGHSGRQAE